MPRSNCDLTNRTIPSAAPGRRRLFTRQELGGNQFSRLQQRAGELNMHAIR
jgi:hypothetical protein